jgi:hypothetical protein
MPLVRVNFFRSDMLRVLVPLALLTAASLAIAQSREPGGSVANVPTNLPPTSTISSDGTQSAPPPAAAGTKPAERLRENTRLADIAGVFQSVGNDSVSFSPAGSKDSYRLLENLALERIIRTLDENRGSRPGTASGIITEFRGTNYLLVTKAIFPSQEGDSSAGR